MQNEIQWACLQEKRVKQRSQNIQFVLDIKCFDIRDRSVCSHLIQLKPSLCIIQNALLIKLKTLYLFEYA